MKQDQTLRSCDLKRLLGALAAFLVIAAALVGYYMLVYFAGGNFREVVSGKVYRSAQPSPGELARWKQRHGIRTVLNLRGHGGEATDEELRTAEELGLNVVSIHLSSNTLPSPGVLAKLIDAIETAELPMLMHCRAGVDRCGTVSVLAAMAIGQEKYEKAKWEAYVPPGPWKRERQANYVHISDLFKGYEDYRKVNEPAGDDWEQFKQWASAGYAQQAVR